MDGNTFLEYWCGIAQDNILGETLNIFELSSNIELQVEWYKIELLRLLSSFLHKHPQELHFTFAAKLDNTYFEMSSQFGAVL